MKNNSKDNPFDDLVLDDEEKELEASFERGEYESSSEVELEQAKKMLQEAAKRHRILHTSKPVTLRINQLDLIKIKSKAKRHNIPYQTLLGAVLHDFAEDKREFTIK